LIWLLAKYLFDKGIARNEKITVESCNGVSNLEVNCFNGVVSSVSINLGKPCFDASTVANLKGEYVNKHITVDGRDYEVTLVNVGNPHCVVFSDGIDGLDLEKIGPQFEYADIFKKRVNTEFVRVVNRTNLRVRVWERGNGETLACGTGACAAVIAAVENGYCDKGADITVKLLGGDLTVNYTDDRVLLTGNAVMVFEGEFEY